MNSKETKEVRQDRAVDLKFLAMDIPRVAVTLVAGIMYRPKRVYLTKNRPRKTGGALVIANHSSFSDPVILGISMGRRMFYLAGELAMGKGLKPILLRGCGCVGIDRNISDLDGIKKAVDVLKRGHYLLMFPQGALKRDGMIQEIKSGVVLMAMQAGVPILPVYVKKGPKWYNRAKIIIGEEFNITDYCDKKFPSMSDIEKMTDIVAVKMHECEQGYFQYIHRKKKNK